MKRRLRAWRSEVKTNDAGMPVEDVNPANTSKARPERDHIGTRHSQVVCRFTTDDIQVSTFRADISAAGNIAQRGDPRV